MRQGRREEFCRSDRARGACGRNLLRGGGQPHLHELRRRLEGALSGLRQDLRADGRGRARPSPHAAGDVRAALRSAFAPDPPRGRQRLPASPSGLAHQNLPLDTIRREVETMELQAERFYVKAAEQAQDVGVRRLLGDLAEAEKGHEEVAAKLTDQILSSDVRAEEDRTNRRMFVLQYVQPGLAGLMDGSVSTLAPLFAAAFATHQNWQTFLVGLAASIGAGISMGFAEALSDDGSLTGRGSPWLRGLTCGLMTTLGGLGHTLPYLVPDAWPNAFWIATTIAGVVVFFELWAIAFIRSRYMDTPFLQAVFQIVLGGAIVLAVGILIGAA